MLPKEVITITLKGVIKSPDKEKSFLKTASKSTEKARGFLQMLKCQISSITADIISEVKTGSML
jgi:hypothetical protein